MILVQLSKDDYNSISDLLAQEMQYFEKTDAPDDAQTWQDISSRFSPIAASESTVLWSPYCSTCKEEMTLEENIPDQAGQMTVIWHCDNCDSYMELHIYPGEGEYIPIEAENKELRARLEISEGALRDSAGEHRQELGRHAEALHGRRRGDSHSTYNREE